jgi:ADP-ribose pyrophosphatase YjhB (NUDIX family)
LNFSEFVNEKSYYEKIQKLAGIVLLVKFNNEERILLVKPKKFNGLSKKWSIPKGKVEEGLSKKQTALNELLEETGIKLPNNIKLKEKYKVIYKKSGILKELKYYIVRLNRNQLNIPIDNFGNVDTKKLNTHEIKYVKFVPLDEAKTMIEWFQEPILKKL